MGDSWGTNQLDEILPSNLLENLFLPFHTATAWLGSPSGLTRMSSVALPLYITAKHRCFPNFPVVRSDQPLLIVFICSPAVLHLTQALISGCLRPSLVGSMSSLASSVFPNIQLVEVPTVAPATRPPRLCTGCALLGMPSPPPRYLTDAHVPFSS